MQAGITIEVRCPRGSVAFQSHVAVADESIRFVQKELLPGQVWTWKHAGILPADIALFAAQTQKQALFSINGTDTLLEGQGTTDFGMIFARRGLETIGTLPFEGELFLLTVTNLSEKLNRIEILIAEKDAETAAGVSPSVSDDPIQYLR